MGISLGSDFTVSTGLALDDRIVAANLTARDAIATLRRYQGMQCYVISEQKNYQLVGGVANGDWQELKGGGGGGGGVGAFIWTANTQAPVRRISDGLRVLDFSTEDTTSMFSQMIRVPDDYVPGTQIFAKGGLCFSGDTSGTFLLHAQTTLIRAGDVVGAFSNAYDSTNTEITVPVVSQELAAIGDVDLCSAIGEIGTEAVAPGDYIRIQIYRDPTTETNPLGEVSFVEDSFRLDFGL